jgi:tetratricopeptide (TPR) repeat protein
VLWNLGQQEEAARNFELALARIDRMSERERLRTRGISYFFQGDYESAMEEYKRLVEKYPADNAGLGNLALAHFYLRQMPAAMEVGRRALEIHPDDLLWQGNYALYAMYAGDFPAAIEKAKSILEQNPTHRTAQLALALSQTGLGRRQEAEQTYHLLEATSARGVSLAAQGLSDLAFYEGRISDAIGILDKGIAGDLANDDESAAARKTVTVARALLTRGDVQSALTAADKAVGLDASFPISFSAGEVYARAGEEKKALQIAAKLSDSLGSDPQAYGKLLEGIVELQRRNPAKAASLITEALAKADLWLGHYYLGLARLESGQSDDAKSQWEECRKRPGEAVALFLDDIPTHSYFPPVHYYLGRALQELKDPAAADAYRTFLALVHEGERTPLLSDAERRLQSFH